MENILIDPALLKNNWMLIGYLADFLLREGKDNQAINRFCEYCARAMVGNSRYTFQNFLTIRKMINKDFGYNITKEDGTGFTVKEFE